MWISVKDKLPMQEGDYLCYYGGGKFTIRHCYEGDPLGFAQSGFTHWQPLPPPPGECRANWISHGKRRDGNIWRSMYSCSKCGAETEIRNHIPRYCLHCGAEMSFP